jgi:all-trans-retinol 13,14-reductase
MKAIVIGSGISGLTAASYLTRAGYQVTIYEQYRVIGGVTASLEGKGYLWDLGQLALEGFGPGEQAGTILAELGLTRKIGLIGGERSYAFPDFIIEKPDEYGGPLWRRERLKELFPDERRGLDRYYRLYVRVMEIMTLARRAERAGGIASLSLRARMYSKLLPLLPRMRWSAQSLMDHLFRSEKLKSVFISILADFVVRPGQFTGLGVPAVNPEPAFDSRIPLRVSRVGCHPSYHFIRGGVGQMVWVMAKEIEKAGGTIRTATPVTRIILLDGKARGVLLGDGSEDSADLVIASGGARELFLDLVGREHLPEDFIKKLEDIPLMESVFMVHLGIDFDPTPYQRGAVCYYYGSYDIEGGIDEIQQGRYHEGRDGFLIYIPTLHTPEIATPGHHALTIYTIAPNELDEGSWDEHREEYAEKLLIEAEKRIPGLRDHATVRVILTPEDFRERTHLRHHALGGVAPVMGKSGMPHRTPVEQLWFVGAQSESGGGINNVMHGAWKTMRMILGDAMSTKKV